LLESAGGQEVSVSEMTLPRAVKGRCNSPADLSPEVRSHLSAEAQKPLSNPTTPHLTKPTTRYKRNTPLGTPFTSSTRDESGVWGKPLAKV
jgi:hypothetical protein